MTHKNQGSVVGGYEMKAHWKIVFDSSCDCPGCWDSRCTHIVCGKCGGHGHTSEKHPKIDLVSESELLREIQEQSLGNENH